MTCRGGTTVALGGSRPAPDGPEPESRLPRRMHDAPQQSPLKEVGGVARTPANRSKRGGSMMKAASSRPVPPGLGPRPARTTPWIARTRRSSVGARSSPPPRMTLRQRFAWSAVLADQHDERAVGRQPPPSPSVDLAKTGYSSARLPRFARKGVCARPALPALTCMSPPRGGVSGGPGWIRTTVGRTGRFTVNAAPHRSPSPGAVSWDNAFGKRAAIAGTLARWQPTGNHEP